MKHITKLLLTIIVTFMLVEVLPVNKISADENEALLILNGVETPYSTIELAFAEANKEENKNCVVKLLKDSKIENQLEVEKEAYFTLDLNGHTIDAQKKDRLIYIDGFVFTPEDDDDDDDRNKPGHLIITDSSPNHTGA